MQDHCAFDYAIVPVVPLQDREEFINVGVVLFCRELKFLGAMVKLDEKRLTALANHVDLEMVQRQLELISRICSGGKDAGAIGEMTQAERFQRLCLRRNTAIQTSPVHCGVCKSPEELEQLFERTARSNY